MIIKKPTWVLNLLFMVERTQISQQDQWWCEFIFTFWLATRYLALLCPSFLVYILCYMTWGMWFLGTEQLWLNTKSRHPQEKQNKTKQNKITDEKTKPCKSSWNSGWWGGENSGLGARLIWVWILVVSRSRLILPDGYIFINYYIYQVCLFFCSSMKHIFSSKLRPGRYVYRAWLLSLLFRGVESSISHQVCTFAF
jgi:hypothetical protein